MEQKRVSFKVAKAIKEAGYPQEKGEFYYSYTGHLFHENDASDEETESLWFCASFAPTYLDVWLWLWREKDIRIKDTYDGAVWVWTNNNESSRYRYISVDTKDPEEAIEEAIKHLVNENLLK